MIKKLLTIIVILLLLITTGCTKSENASGSLEAIELSELEDKFINHETFFFFVGQSWCPHCKQHKEDIAKYMENHPLIMYYVNADDDIDYFLELVELFFPEGTNTEDYYTPTNYYVVDGKIIDSVEGNLDKPALETWFKRLQITLPLKEQDGQDN